LILSYCDRTNMPIVVVLYKSDIPDYEILGLNDRLEKFIFVDIENTDYAMISEKLNSMLNQN